MSDSEEEVAFESADEGDEDNKTDAEREEKTRKKNSKDADHGDKESETTTRTEGAEAATEPDTKPSSQTIDLGAGDSTTEDSEKKEQSDTQSLTEASNAETLRETSSSVKKSPDIDSPDVGQSELKKNEKETPESETSKSDAEKLSPENPPESVETKTKSDSPKLTESGDAKTREAVKETGDLKTGETRTRERTPTRKVERQGAKNEDAEDDDKSEEKARVLDKLADAAESRSGGWGWGNWGSSILSTATSSVSTFTHSVGDGFNTIVESAEAALGALSPEELAAKQQEEKEEEGDSEQVGEKKEEPKPPKKEKVVTEPKGEEIEGREVETEEGAGKGEEEETDEKKEDEDGWFSWGTSPAAWGITSGLSNVTKTVQKTSKTLVTGSLDVLETIGKKTYDVIAEGDHGLRETIKKSGQKPILSQVLKEAQEEAKSRAEQDAEYEESRKCHFGAQFDDFQGMVQLEALEMLSNQCEGKLHNLLGSLPADELGSLKQELVTIKQAFEIDELDSDEDEDKDHDFDRLMADHVGQLGLNTTAERLIQVQEKGRKWLSDCMADQEAGTQKPAKDIHQVAIQRLAEFTARCVDQFLKIGQLVLLEKSLPVSSFKGKAQNLAEITKVLCAETGILSTKFTKCLNTAADDSEDPDSVTPLITNVYLEASNSGTYIQDAFQLLLPALQQALVETSQTQKLES